MEVSGQLHSPVALLPGYPLDRRLGWPQSRSGRGKKKTLIIHPVGQGYTCELSRHLQRRCRRIKCRSDFYASYIWRLCERKWSSLIFYLHPLRFCLPYWYSCSYIAGINMRMYPKVSGLAAWRENCKWYSSLPRGGAVSLFCEPVW
jgi:hypothetical protein